MRKDKRLIAAIGIALLVLAGASLFAIKTKAEQSGSSPNNNPTTSRILATYNSLVSLGHGVESAGSWGDWGVMWNRIRSAAEWVPSDSAVVGDVKSTKTFHNTSRTQQTGTYPAPGPCSTQQYHDNYGAPVTQTTNCVNNITWIANPTPVTGDDATGMDPRTGLTWSQLLLNSSGTVTFSPTTNSAWSWDASAAANVAVGNKTASQICSERGNSWRLPSQKELMQAYIDGSYFKLTQPSYYFWSVTEYSSTNAWYVYLYYGLTTNNSKTTSNQVRCVR